MIVSFAKDISEYSEVAREYGTAYEINDFCEPSVLDSPEKMEEIIKVYKQVGVACQSTMHGAFYDVIVHSKDKAVADISKMRMRQSMEVARKLGLRGVVFHTNYQPGIPGKAYRNNVVNKLTEFFSELLEEYSEVDIYLENMFEEDASLILELSKWLKQYPNYGVCFDYGHALVYGENINEWVESLSPYIKHVHINDNDLKEDLHLAIGNGKIDWKKFMEYREEYFPKASVLIEVWNAKKQKESLEYLKELGMIR